jgi:2-oxoglutarate ferredoxin oxidoreductase subunit gamma
MKYSVRLTGSGGQGIILASIILAEAAGIYDGKNVVQSQVYGAAARGEISKADVIISDEEIYFPEVRMPDVLLTLTQESYNEFTKSVKDDSKVIVDEFGVWSLNSALKNFSFPITKTAIDVTSRRISANIVALGIISGLTDVVSIGALKSALGGRFKNNLDVNLMALEKGFELGQKGVKNG